MKKFLSFIIGIFATLFTISVFAETQLSFDKIVIFGDSVSDNGNLSHALHGYIPKVPPYYQGRFSNGPIWSDNIANYFLEHDNITTENDAVGAETANVHEMRYGYLPFSLKTSLNNYYFHSLFKDRAHTLFIIWLGSNDYLQDDNDVEHATDAVIQSMQKNIEGLISEGAKNILLFTIPDRSLTPLSAMQDKVFLHGVTLAHNSKLLAMVAALQNKYPSIKLHTFDAYQVIIDIMNNLSVYNEKYHTHLSNITDACWTGSYHNIHAEQEADILSALKSKEPSILNIPTENEIDYATLAHTITINPDLQITFAFDDNATICENPDDHIFWDHVHPTTVAHGILSDVVITQINQLYTK